MYAVITTDNNRRGVFAGDIESHDIASGTAVLTNAQMCVYWSKETHGVLGLASNGPAKGSRVTPIIPRLQLNGVTAVMEATDKARKAWEAQPWV